jgi:type VI secretion system protein ImpK
MTMPDTIQPGLTPNDLLQQVLLLRSVALARAGHYDAAEQLLSQLKRAGTPVAALDLLARIRAQQGRLAEAEKLWIQATEFDPSNDTYAAALRRIARRQRRPTWLSILAGLVLGGVLVILGLELLGGRGPREAVNPPMTPNDISPASTGVPTGTEPSVPPQLNIHLVGVQAKAEGSEVVVTFTSGLFLQRSTLTPDARELLGRLAKQLEPMGSRLTIRVVGHTDDTTPPPGFRYPDNTALGLARAMAVAEHLRESSTLPRTVFLLQSLGEEAPPYPNDSRENRARNRTVVLRVSRARP